MHDVDRARRAAAAPGRCRPAPSTLARRAGTPARPVATQVAVRLDAVHRARRSRRSAGRWKPVPQPRSSTTRPGPVGASAHGAARAAPSRSTAWFSSSYVAGCCQMFGLGTAAPGSAAALRSSAAGVRPGPARVGVWNCAAMMPGVPLGATHSTFTSSSGDSTVSPSHSLTRCGSPAISRQASDQSGLPPADGCSVVGAQPLTKNGSCGSEIRPLTPICFQTQLGAVGTVPVARRRPRGPRRFSTVAMSSTDDDPAEPAAAEGGAGAHGLAERRLVGGRVVEHLDHLEVGVVGQRQDHVAGPESRVDTSVDELTAEQPPDALGGAGEAVRAGGED